MSPLITEPASSTGARTFRSITSRPDGSRIVNEQVPFLNKGIYNTFDPNSYLQKINDSVVGIFYRDKLGLHSGSGIVVSPKGHILTNKHVVKSAIRNNVQMYVVLRYFYAFFTVIIYFIASFIEWMASKCPKQYEHCDCNETNWLLETNNGCK